MAITTTAPYTSGIAVLSVMRRFREKGLTIPITGDVLVRAGVSETLVPRTMQSLQILGLIDDAGQPTPTFQKMRSVPEADYKKTLAEWMQSVYADIFKFADPNTDDLTRVRDAFRTYVPHGQQDRMVSLFLSLCAEAGLAPEGKKSEPMQAARKPITARSTQAPARNKVVVKERDRIFKRGGNDDVNVGHFPPALAGLLQSIPSAATGWTQQQRDKFVSTFGTVLDFVVPIVSEEALQELEEDEEDIA